MKLTVILHKEEDMYVALCPKLNTASQGYIIEKAKSNLKEAVSLFFECVSKEEIKKRWKSVRS
jgi:predicted RNase H-like HicB family nuclease